MGSDHPRGTCENVLYHFHGTIQIIIPSYLRPVVNYFLLSPDTEDSTVNMGQVVRLSSLLTHRQNIKYASTVLLIDFQ